EVVGGGVGGAAIGGGRLTRARLLPHERDAIVRIALYPGVGSVAGAVRDDDDLDLVAGIALPRERAGELGRDATRLVVRRNDDGDGGQGAAPARRDPASDAGERRQQRRIPEPRIDEHGCRAPEDRGQQAHAASLCGRAPAAVSRYTRAVAST